MKEKGYFLSLIHDPGIGKQVRIVYGSPSQQPENGAVVDPVERLYEIFLENNPNGYDQLYLLRFDPRYIYNLCASLNSLPLAARIPVDNSWRDVIEKKVPLYEKEWALRERRVMYAYQKALQKAGLTLADRPSLNSSNPTEEEINEYRKANSDFTNKFLPFWKEPRRMPLIEVTGVEDILDNLELTDLTSSGSCALRY